VGASAPAVYLRALGPLQVRDARGEDPRALLVQPKRLALLVYIALNGPGTLHQREKLCGMFWPDSPEELARLSLRQALHFLRRATSSEIIDSRLGTEIRVRPDAVHTDVADFETAIAEHRREDAIALYHGEFLQDFHVSGVSSEFEWWLDRQRARLRGLAVRAATELIDTAERDGDFGAAIRATRELLRITPFDEPALRRLVTLLDRSGDRAGALQEYQVFTARLAREIESSPSAETAALIARVRAKDAGPTRESRPVVTVVAPPRLAKSADIAPNASGTAVSSPHRVGPGWRRAAVLTLIPMAGIAWVALTAPRTRPAQQVVLAVGEIHSRARDTLLAPALIRDLLASDLARIDGIDVVSGERIEELMAQLGSSGDTSAKVINAARRAGATQVLEGIISGGGGTPLRLDVRRADLRDGTIRGALVVEAPDVFSLADQLSAQVAGQVGRRFPSRPLAEMRSQSLAAGRLYAEGARAFYQGDPAAAIRLFDAALRQDSMFTMAALLAAKAAWDVAGDSMAFRYLDQARRAARRATDRERLLVETEFATRTNSPNVVAIAESLATRYPSEPAGDAALGEALYWTGDRDRAIPHLRLAIERDSTGLGVAPSEGPASRVWCRACDAFNVTVLAQIESDSLAAAERTANEWIRRRPVDPRPWAKLADVYDLSGRLDDARVAWRENTRLLGRNPSDAISPGDAIFRARLAMHAGAYSAADAILGEQLASSDAGTRRGTLWWAIISLRQQGRMREALQRATELIGEEEARPGPHDGGSLGRIARAEITFELGQPRQAAAMFEASAVAPIVGDVPARMQGRAARRAAWNLTHAATAYAAAGDTGQLVRLAAAVESYGRSASSGRDRRLYHYVRALLLEARHDWAGAESEFRLAISSPNLGFTRINFELARTLVAQNRPREAIPILQSALRGGLEASNYYVTHPELHEALGRAFALTGQPDSARVHRAVVSAAWSSGDAPYRARAADARR
jgi:DNA-binding SARP family transcriptional activator/predicted Zn-dependent protease